MRVIAGKARSLRLKTIDGPETRPTADRIKETLFNMINDQIPECSFLDLFSGSGGIGIEALSRGAKQCYFVDNNPACTKCIKENLMFTRLNDTGIVLECDALTALHRLEDCTQFGSHIFEKHIFFDFIFMDPPYNRMLEQPILEFLSKSRRINEHTTIIIEVSLETEPDYCKRYGFSIIKEKRYKTNKHIFIRRLNT